MADPVAFFRRRFPSANAVLLHGPLPVLVDGGFGSDVPALVAWLHAQGTPPETLSLVVNTHFDCDHAGANHRLQTEWGLAVAAHRVEAQAVNGREPGACRARYLRQPVEAYRVDRVLEAGDCIDTGAARWTVVHTPGHTDGHISLHNEDAGLLVTGDAVHADDLGWIDATRPEALEMAEATMRRLAGLRLRRAWSGHGPVTEDPEDAIARAARRLAEWRRAPERMAWHGAKRVFAYDLMVEDGLAEADVAPFLIASPWFTAYASRVFAASPPELVAPMVAEMLRSGAARWLAGRLVAGAPFNPPPPGWARGPLEPDRWPPP